MTFDSDGVARKQAGGEPQYKTPTYRCGFFGCSVRYEPGHGYSTRIDASELPQFVEEPAVKTLLCAIHKTRLYRRKQASEGGFEWYCGYEGSEYCHQDVRSTWLRQ